MESVKADFVQFSTASTKILFLEKYVTRVYLQSVLRFS